MEHEARERQRFLTLGTHRWWGGAPECSYDRTTAGDDLRRIVQIGLKARRAATRAWPRLRLRKDPGPPSYVGQVGAFLGVAMLFGKKASAAPIESSGRLGASPHHA